MSNPSVLEYSIVEQIAVNSKSTIYRAELSTGEPVFLKVLHDDYPSPRDLARFRREFELTRALDCPGVIEARALEKDGNSPVMILEDFGGEALAHLLKRESLDLETSLELVLETANALTAIHTQGVIHRDINPANIVWNREDNILKIIDFGIAVTRSQQQAMPDVPSRLDGTLPYVSPEQTGRTGRSVDYRTDFYSLGITFYELLTGQRPFDGDDPMALVHAHLALHPESPTDVDPTIPSIVSAIVIKLMAKDPEERYQSAYGLRVDLKRCLQKWRCEGRIEEFALGASDVRQTLRVPQRLYGRDEQRETLLTCFDRVANGARELALIAGYSGIGKSALVRSLYQPLTERRGYFVSGKFGQYQYQRDVPYSGIIEALRDLVDQIAASDDAELEAQKNRIQEAIAPNGQLIVDLVPELEWMIGEQPPAQDLPPSEAKNAQMRVFRQFIGACCGRHHPLILFIDDLQWADRISLQLLEGLMTDETIDHLLILGAYRDNEVDPSHPLVRTVKSLRDQQQTVDELKLRVLSRGDVESLLADTVQRLGEEVEQLADMVYQKTGGNPFFVTRFIETLGADDLIWFSPDEGRWQWDLERIVAEDTTDNVVELLIERLELLPEQTREAIEWASLLGNRFELTHLAMVAGKSPADTYEALQPAIETDVIDPLSEETTGLDDRLVVHKLKFPHDRILQAAAELSDDDERIEARRRLAEIFIEELSEDELEEKIFAVTAHLNAARQLFDSPAEHLRVARLNLQAGRRALKSQAHDSAVQHLEVAMESLSDDSWQAHPELTFEIYLYAVDAKGAVGQFDEAVSLARQALDHVDDPIVQAELYNLLIRYMGLAARYEEAVEATANGLAVLDVDYPLTDLEQAIEAKTEHIKQDLEERPLETLADAPVCEDEKVVMAQKILATADPVMSLYDPYLMISTVLTSFELSLEYGMTNESGTGAAGYATRLTELQEFETAYKAGRLAIDLCDRFDNLSNKTISCCVQGALVMGWSRPIRQTIPILEEGFEAGASSGSNMSYAGFTQTFKAAMLFLGGFELDEVLEEARFGIDFGQKAKNFASAEGSRAILLAVRNLTGQTEGKFGFDDDTFDDADSFIAHCQDEANNYALCQFLFYSGQIYYLYGDSRKAVDLLERAGPLIEFMLGSVNGIKLCFYMALALADLGASASCPDEYLERIAPLRDRLEKLSASCTENFEHKLHLVDAEIARINGDVAEAVDLYDEAIEQATKYGFVHMAALANERATILWHDRDKPRLARLYFQDALYGYRQWGARRKVDDLNERFSDLTPSIDNRSTGTATHTSMMTTEATTTSEVTGTSGLSHSLDALSVIKISQTIAGELELEPLLSSLMQISIENAGAQSGALFWSDDSNTGKLVVAVESLTAGDEPDVLPQVALADWSNGPRSIINYVHRTAQMVVLGDAAGDERFNSDPYLRANSVRSILCLPVKHRSELRGVLYLANELGRDAFTPRHVEVLKILASQSAIALENANLYRDLKEENAARREAEIQLEKTLHDVEEARDEALRASEAKSKFLATMSHELRTPLNAIIGYSDLLHEQIDIHPDDTDEFIMEDITRINHAGHHLLSLINNLLDISKIEAGETTIQVTEFALETVVEQALVNLAIEENSDNELTIDIAPDVGTMCSDATKVHQCITNLVENADKFTEDGSISLRAWRERRDDEDWVIIQVEDTGIGIEPQHQKVIYDRFSQVDSSFTRQHDGTGLGLTITKSCCQALGGTITLESEPGIGSTFTLSLPADFEAVGQVNAPEGV